MITKKTFVTTTSFLITATLLSQFYSFASARFESNSANFEAFSNFSNNVSSIIAAPSISTQNRLDNTINDEVIGLINLEVKKKISNTRYAINNVRVKTPNEPKQVIAKNINLVPVIPLIKEDLSEYEINSESLVDLYAISVEQMAFAKFADTNVAEIKDEVVVAQASTGPTIEQVDATIESDEVKMIQPSSERQAVPEVAEVAVTEVADSEEMVMFDYSDKKEVAAPGVKTIDQKLYERPISNTVKAAINREIGSLPVRKNTPVTTAKIENLEVDLESEENTVYDYSTDSVKRTENASKDIEAAVSAFAAKSDEPAENTQFVIKAREVNVNTQKTRKAHAFEFVPDYERAERSDDQTSGEITLGYSLAGTMNTQTGVIQAQGMIPTRVELNLATLGIEIPLINEAGIQQFLQKEGLSIEGNLIMVATDSSIEETELDTHYSHRFYFDNKFKIVEEKSQASYTLFAGVKSGNVMIRYLLSSKEIAQKIVYVGDGEMYFEDPDFSNSVRETFTFTTRNLLGQKRKELIIDGTAINYFNSQATAKKKALNAYEIKIPAQVTGSRKYFEFKHLKDSIFVGSSAEKEIEIPGNDFIAKVMEMNQVNSLKERCIVQVNLSNNIREIKANGKNRSGEMFVETSFIDNDGNFSRDSELAEKAFIVGDMEGLFNVRLDYTDGSTEFLKTFCSEGTYLVEQL